MIAATAGTTSAGMIDTLPECATISRQHGLWYHVDAAWGGALIAPDRRRNELIGLELADSATIDAHKPLWGAECLSHRIPPYSPMCFMCPPVLCRRVSRASTHISHRFNGRAGFPG
jgi:hypothetical protein